MLRVVTTDFLGCPLWLFLYLQYILSIASRSFLPLCLAFVFNAIFVCLPHVILTGVCPFNSRDVNMFCNLTFWLFDQILNCYFVCRPFRKVLNIINQVAAEWIPSACNIFRVFFITLHKKWTFKDFFNKYDQIRRKLRRSHVVKKSLMKNFNFCAV